MITVELYRSKNGGLLSCSAKGHAHFSKKGTDIVCAAVTALLRTTVSVLAEYDGVVVAVETPVRGELVFRVSESANETECLIYAADFLQKGLSMIAAEYPANVEIRVNVL